MNIVVKTLSCLQSYIMSIVFCQYFQKSFVLEFFAEGKENTRVCCFGVRIRTRVHPEMLGAVLK